MYDDESCSGLIGHSVHAKTGTALIQVASNAQSEGLTTRVFDPYFLWVVWDSTYPTTLYLVKCGTHSTISIQQSTVIGGSTSLLEF